MTRWIVRIDVHETVLMYVEAPTEREALRRVLHADHDLLILQAFRAVGPYGPSTHVKEGLLQIFTRSVLNELYVAVTEGDISDHAEYHTLMLIHQESLLDWLCEEVPEHIFQIHQVQPEQWIYPAGDNSESDSTS